MSENHNAANTFNFYKLWDNIVRIYQILSVIGISIVMVFLTWLTFFKVDQVEDAIIALGNFGTMHHFVIFILIGTLWAFLVWYWAWVFYYAKYLYLLNNEEGREITGLKDYELRIIYHAPWILGAVTLLILGLSFLTRSSQCGDVSPNPLLMIGIVFLILTALFALFIYRLTKIVTKKSHQQQVALPANQPVVPVIKLPSTSKGIILITTAVVIILLVALMIAPITLTRYLGDGVTVLISCFCIWLPLLYWVRYFSLKLGFPLFLILAVLVAVFSFFNGNTNVRLVKAPTPPNSETNPADYSALKTNLSDYYNYWKGKIAYQPQLKNDQNDTQDKRTPLIIVLSEGGGIRAAYWSAQMLARIQRDYPHFRDNLFCISGVSGGSFGASIFDSLLYEHDHQQNLPYDELQKKIRNIAGKDILSPTIACMLTRGVVQLLVPVPIPSFDNAKVFEKTWELYWQEEIGDRTFSQPFLSLWPDKSLFTAPTATLSPSIPAPTPVPIVPALFLNATQVENGYPVIVSNLSLYNECPKTTPAPANVQTEDRLIEDFHINLLHQAPNDVPISTASHLSARFPYISPAGTLTGENGANIGLVDGGLFENTGSNTAFQVLLNLKGWYDKTYPGKSIYRDEIKPVIVYLQNGAQVPDTKGSGRTMFYQLLAPIETYLQQRDSHAVSGILNLKELVEFYNGEFITYSLQQKEYIQTASAKKADQQTVLPLGWALSKTAQDYIDKRVKDIDITGLLNYLK